jgi:hypothetical protein
VNMLKGVIHNRQVILLHPADLPEGTEVEILPVGLARPADEGPLTTNEITRTLAAMEAIQPFELSELERAAIVLDREARNEWEKSRFKEHAEWLREIWE